MDLALIDYPDTVFIAKLLANRKIEFLNRQEAIDFCEKQTPLWRSLFTSLEERGPAKQLFSALQNNIDQARFDVVEPSTPDSSQKFEVVGRIPLLTKDSLASLQRLSKGYFTLVAAAVLSECRDIGEEAKIVTMSLDLMASMVAYASGGTPTQDLAARLSQFENRLQEAQTKATNTSKTLQDDSEKFIAEEREKLTSFKSSLSEEIKLRSASSLWSDRALWHRVVAAVSLLFFIGIICGALFYIFTNFQWVVDRLPRDKDGHVEYVSVALLAIPAIGVGWCLKVLARFIQTNSILGDDSRQRQAMTRTYLTLVADKDSQVTEKDRLVMLNAIFRPLPGSQSDEIAPPTILDLLKKSES